MKPIRWSLSRRRYQTIFILSNAGEQSELITSVHTWNGRRYIRGESRNIFVFLGKNNINTDVGTDNIRIICLYFEELNFTPLYSRIYFREYL